MQKAFKDSAKWLKKAIMDETFKQYLNQDRGNCRFNLSRASWWGG